MDSIGYHCGTVPQNTRHKLENEQDYVDRTTCKRNLVYLFLSVHTRFLVIIVLGFAKIVTFAKYRTIKNGIPVHTHSGI